MHKHHAAWCHVAVNRSGCTCPMLRGCCCPKGLLKLVPKLRASRSYSDLLSLALGVTRFCLIIAACGLTCIKTKNVITSLVIWTFSWLFWFPLTVLKPAACYRHWCRGRGVWALIKIKPAIKQTKTNQRNEQTKNLIKPAFPCMCMLVCK